MERNRRAVSVYTTMLTECRREMYRRTADALRRNHPPLFDANPVSPAVPVLYIPSRDEMQERPLGDP